MTKWVSAAVILVLATGVLADQGLDSRFEKDVLIIEASEHACHRFDIYVAVSAEQRSRGLMFVREMSPSTGMLFVYTNEPVSMWMKNTYISLDMVFVRADGTVSSVIRNTEPQSLKSLRSIEPVAFVLELNAGVTERLGIDENSRIFWEPAHGNVE
ncbi:MAG: DUF192 domain-containing protein [Woeseiaceae bacterium]